MAYITREKKKGYEHDALKIRPLLGRDKRIIQIPLNEWYNTLVGAGLIAIDNDEEELMIKKMPGFYDEGIIITGEGK